MSIRSKTQRSGKSHQPDQTFAFNFRAKKVEVPAIALVCAATTSNVAPDSRCSRVSPTQAITLMPWESAYATLSPTNCIQKWRGNGLRINIFSDLK